MNPDGTMAHGEQIEAFAKLHQLPILSIDDIIAYRLCHENLIAEEASTMLPTEDYGVFKLTAIKDIISGDTHIVLENDKVGADKAHLVRIHSSCITGDLFCSKRCDCNKQFHYALQRISQEGGMLIYLNQEGRGIGLLNKIKAYALQEQGFDTVEANVELGLPIDARQYYLAAAILRQRNLSHIRLLTNNPAKVSDLKRYGIETVESETMPSFHNEHNEQYIKTKIEKLKHVIHFDSISELRRSS
jgi:3,4-dihydroxy 2-butanone 4-phosphate synthase/GTP cyclohydrolase II